MRYLVISDNHGDREILVAILEKYKDSVDYFFHCGDSELSPDDELWDSFLVVGGNCDYAPQYQSIQVIDTGIDKILMTHGHLYNVRFGLTQLALKAEEVAANLVFFGHTHEIGCMENAGVLFLNPGSISQPRGQIRIPAYAIIDSTDTTLFLQYYNRAYQEIEELRFSFSK